MYPHYRQILIIKYKKPDEKSRVFNFFFKFFPMQDGETLCYHDLIAAALVKPGFETVCGRDGRMRPGETVAVGRRVSKSVSAVPPPLDKERPNRLVY
jgi:hypothetical protein